MSYKMLSKHTKGPWSRDRYGHIVDMQGNFVMFRSVTCNLSGDGVAEAEANTDLVAAAPELLVALGACLSILGYEEKDIGCCDKIALAMAAIDKATGATALVEYDRFSAPNPGKEMFESLGINVVDATPESGAA